MGTAGTRYGELRTALRTGSYELARDVAADLPHVGLRDALALTMLASHKQPADFEPLARRWLCRWIEETRPSLDEIEEVAGDLRHTGDPRCLHAVKVEAEERLRKL